MNFQGEEEQTATNAIVIYIRTGRQRFLMNLFVGGNIFRLFIGFPINAIDLTLAHRR